MVLSDKLKSTFSAGDHSPEHWVEICDALAEEFGGVGTAIIPVDKNVRLPWLVHSKSLEKVTRTYLKDNWYLRDVRERGLATIYQKGYTKDSDFVSPEEMERTPYYRDFLRPHGIGGFLAILFIVDGENWVASIQLPLKMQDPDPSKFHLVPEVRKLLEKAAETSLHSVRKNITQLMQNTALLNRGVIFLTAVGEIAEKNSLATTLLKRFRLEISEAGFPGPDLKNIIRQSIEGYEGKQDLALLHVTASKEDSDLVCSISVVPNELRLFNSSVATMIVLEEVKGFNVRYTELLIESYGLTKKEILLTSRLIEGEKLKEASENLNITEGNARQHLKRIFKKVEVESQLELAVKIMKQCSVMTRSVS